ncbi:hypothetical protein [Limosilactobacillus reuteri]|uniref:hypothetical protein n=1 Tax=Limosilactobacillus reuteri TaxID=1598 RepID=UPI001E39B96B|nr:hypothetical protein [Limosilactobacillus reuteri]MCC4466492.1 hypothetical protein [Limosilactobacillus reuteri]MCC4472168.1 hypothetical protein [Limosilactobacillus reuteri]
MSFPEFNSAKQYFSTFSKDVLNKQERLASRHKESAKRHADFKARLDKKFNNYSK